MIGGSKFVTDAAGIAACLGLQSDTKIALEELIEKLERKISAKTLMTL
jgi:hypothetical protein